MPRAVTAAKLGNGVFADDEFGAAAAHVEDEDGEARQFRIAGHAAEDPFGLLLPGEYLDGQSRIRGGWRRPVRRH